MHSHERLLVLIIIVVVVDVVIIVIQSASSGCIQLPREESSIGEQSIVFFMVSPTYH